MDGGSREAVSSSEQLEDWAAGVAADLNAEDNAEAPRRRIAEQAVTSPARQRSVSNQICATVKRSRQVQERESSPDEDQDHDQDQDAKDGPRPKLPRPEKKETCPRCNSLDTKFCYYNNYNIKQPRFYCKTCQRYWTAGGTLRNIAPGSGRRKSKSKALAVRDIKNVPTFTDHLSAAAAMTQTSVFALPVGTTATYPNLLADPTGILSSSAAATAYPQLLAGHNGLSGLKLAGVSQLPGSWAGGLPADIQGGAALREHLQAQLGTGAPGLGHQSGSTLDARLLLNGQHHQNGPPGAAAAAAHVGQHGHTAQQQQHHADGAHPSSPSASPPPQHQQQISSPQQPHSQISQQPSPPQAQPNCSASEDPDGEGAEVCVPGRRIRLKTELEHPTGNSGTGYANSELPQANGATGSSSLQNLQLASLSLPPSMASLAAVMGPGGGAGSIGASLHPLLSQQDTSTGGLLEAGPGALSRHHLQLALQHHQAMQHDNLQQLNGLLPHSSVAAAAALQAQHHTLLHGLGHQGVSAAGAQSGAAAAVAALDPLQRSALLQQAAGLGAVGNWLHGGGGMSGMLPSAAVAAAALESLQVQSLASNASSLLQMQAQPAATMPPGSGSAAEWLSLAAAAACPKGQSTGGVTHPSAAAAAVAAAHAANLGAGSSVLNGAAHVLQAQAAAAAAGGSCGSGISGWPGSGPFTFSGGPPSWSLWSSYNNPASSNYAGYALQAAAAAAAYSNGR